MVVANTALGEATTNEVSLIVNQSIGVILVSLILIFGHKNKTINPPREKAFWWMYFGGLFGVVVMVCNFYSVLNIGAGLAMAAAVFGQSLTGLVLDLFGLFGMTKRKQNARKFLSLLVSFIGIAVMSLSSSSGYSILFIFIGILAGVFTMLQMTYNSSFAKRKGALFSARQNALSGLLGTLVYAFILFPSNTLEGFTQLPSVPFTSIILGGTLAIVVVTTTNLVIPKIPAIYSALLLSSGQILASLFFDSFSWPLLCGALLMLLGIILNFFAEKETGQLGRDDSPAKGTADMTGENK